MAVEGSHINQASHMSRKISRLDPNLCQKSNFEEEKLNNPNGQSQGITGNQLAGTKKELHGPPGETNNNINSKVEMALNHQVMTPSHAKQINEAKQLRAPENKNPNMVCEPTQNNEVGQQANALSSDAA